MAATKLFERESSLIALNDRLARAAEGSGGVVLVCGEAGVGKSALIAAWSDEIRDRAQVLVGACDPLSTPRPLGPVADTVLFDSLGARRPAALIARQLRDQGVANLPRGPRSSSRSNPAGLTNREMLVLQHILRDRSNREIADELFVSSKTIESHITSIFAKLGVQSRPAAVRAALALGLETT